MSLDALSISPRQLLLNTNDIDKKKNHCSLSFEHNQLSSRGKRLKTASLAAVHEIVEVDGSDLGTDLMNSDKNMRNPRHTVSMREQNYVPSSCD